MYGKLFTSLYQGTLRGKPDEILVFTNLIAHADQHGCVDIHYRAISDEVGISIERVQTAIANLEAPDPESRSPEEDGKRLIPLDEHRAWGWHIVNYAKYRSIRNEEDRREQNRLAQQKWREKHKISKVSRVSQDKPKQIQKQIQKKEEVVTAKPKLSDEEWLSELQSNPAYQLLNVRNEYARAQVWAETNNRQCTRRFFVGWINRAKPMQVNGNEQIKNNSSKLQSAADKLAADEADRINRPIIKPPMQGVS